MKKTKGIVAKKIEMGQVFTADGSVVPVTIVRIVDQEWSLNPGDTVDVIGTSKGKGFAGVVKRWGFAGGPKTHGQSDKHRSPGSIGAGTDPGRVWKGKKMPGRMGGMRTTVKNLSVVEIQDGGLVYIKGAIPGSRHSQVEIVVSEQTSLE